MSASGQKQTLWGARQMSALGQKQTLVSNGQNDLIRAHDSWRRPRSIDDRGFRPVAADKERELTRLRRRQPIGALVICWRVGLHVDRQRAVSIVPQRLGLGANRVALDLVGLEEVLRVVESQ